MNGSLECIPCFISQGLNVARLATDDEKVHNQVLREDLVVAKGQANFESLDGCEKDVFFLFKAKCPVVANHIGCPVGSLVLHHNSPRTADRAAAMPQTEAR